MLCADPTCRKHFEPLNRRTNRDVPGQYSRPYLRPDTTDPAWTALFTRLLDGHDGSPAAQRVLLKEIRMTALLGWLSARFSCHVIWLVRHPCAVVASRLLLGWTPHINDYLQQDELVQDYLTPPLSWLRGELTLVEQQAAMWAIENLVPLRQRQDHGAWQLICYESLLRAGPPGVRAIADGCRLDLDERVLAERWAAPSRVTRPQSAARRLPGSATLASGWQDVLSPSAQEQVLSIVHRLGLDELVAMCRQAAEDRHADSAR
jgi:hypothetical protein